MSSPTFQLSCRVNPVNKKRLDEIMEKRGAKTKGQVLTEIIEYYRKSVEKEDELPNDNR